MTHSVTDQAAPGFGGPIEANEADAEKMPAHDTEVLTVRDASGDFIVGPYKHNARRVGSWQPRFTRNQVNKSYYKRV